MASMIFHVFSSAALLSLGLYHTVAVSLNFLKSPQSYAAKPFHHFPPSSHHHLHRLRYLQLYIAIPCLVIAFAHQAIAAAADPVRHFVALQSAAVVFLFLIFTLLLLVSDSTSILPVPADLFFALASAIFFLQFSISSMAASVTSDLQAKCDSVSGRIAAVSSFLCLALACLPRLFVADIGLGAMFLLQGLWALQTGLSLYVEAFIPEGCHRLLDVVTGAEGSTKCDLEESRLRAVAVLDLAFLIHVVFVVLVVIVVYGVVARSVGVRRIGSYEALPPAAAALVENNHVQMKALTGTQA